MSWAIGGLMAGFILLAGLVLVLTLQTRLPLGYKIAAVLAITGFYWVQYHALNRYAGWPSTEPLPEEFLLIASKVIEPDPSTGRAGLIYWWIQESNVDQEPPRVYELPYVKEVHEQSQEVLAEQEQGAQFVGRISNNATGRGIPGVRFERINKSELYQKK